MFRTLCSIFRYSGSEYKGGLGDMKMLASVQELAQYEAFLESAPQAVLQFMIIIRTGHIAGE